jgi:pyruvate formate lyase activating enzyme
MAPGEVGNCRVRVNENGKGGIPYYGRLSSVAIDPIEKKPLYHFHPGRSILSVGFWGCNFHCPFCQNYQISQTANLTPVTPPEKLVAQARRDGSVGIAYTYTEPLIHFEYVMDTAALAREQGLKNVLVTAGYVSPEPAARILPLMDGANVDLKGWKDQFYREEIGGDLQTVRRFITRAAALTHLEVTTLIIPGKNDDQGQIEAISSFLAELNPEIPYHLSAYYPAYRYKIPATPAETVLALAQVARRRLHHVYVGNLRGQDTDTLCAGCGSVLVRRNGYRAVVVGTHQQRCQNCGHPAPLVLDGSDAGDA